MQKYLLFSHFCKKQSGFSLLEVLISIIVLSFGVLGAVGLQATSLQANREARLQASAARLGEEIAELMRGNKNIAIKTTSSAENPYLVSIKSGDSDPANPNCGYPGKNACATNEDIAKRDVYDWWKRIDGIKNDPDNDYPATLPGARVVICEDSTPYDGSGLPQWACSNSGGLLVLKMGWTRANTLRGATGTDATDANTVNTGAFDKALRPSILFPINPGSST